MSNKDTENVSFTNKIAPRLRSARKAAGYIQKDVAEKLGISRPALTNIENGLNMPNLEYLFTMSVMYQVPLNELVGAPEIKKPVELSPGTVQQIDDIWQIVVAVQPEESETLPPPDKLTMITRCLSPTGLDEVIKFANYQRELETKDKRDD